MDGCHRKCPVKTQLKKTSILVFLAVLLFFNNGCNSQSHKTAEIMSGTIKPELFFQTREDVPEWVVYEMLKVMFSEEGRTYLETVQKAFREMSPGIERFEKIALPLHPGAEKFYKEMGFIK